MILGNIWMKKEKFSGFSTEDEGFVRTYSFFVVHSSLADLGDLAGE